MTERTLATTLLLVIISALALAGVITFSGEKPIWDTIRVELVKYLLQLIVIIVIGGVVAALFKMLEHSRDLKLKKEEDVRETAQKIEEEYKRRAQLRASIHEEYLRKLGTLYRRVKSSRRLLRSEGLTSKFIKPSILTDRQIDTYRREMKQIDAAQLELEGLTIESERLPVFMEVSDLTENLLIMEGYLRDILSEYEKFAPLLGSDNSPGFKELKRLDEFTGTTQRDFPVDRFLSCYWKPYDDIVVKISTAISEDTPNKWLEKAHEDASH